jgi:hypothetical protein
MRNLKYFFLIGSLILISACGGSDENSATTNKTVNTSSNNQLLTDIWSGYVDMRKLDTGKYTSAELIKSGDVKGRNGWLVLFNDEMYVYYVQFKHGRFLFNQNVFWQKKNDLKQMLRVMNNNGFSENK